MNSFDGFALSGANKTRYVPIFGDSAGIIGAYRKAMGVRTIARVKRYGKIELGLVPLFLLDGELSVGRLSSAAQKLCLQSYAAVYRPFDIRIKKRYEDTYKRCRQMGFIKKNGSIAEWVLEDKRKAETNQEYFFGIEPYLDYEKAKEEYDAAVLASPIDVTTGIVITGDINTFLYERAKAIYPFGVESILEANTKQSAITKQRFFVDGLENAPVPKGVKHGGGQVSLFEADRINIYDTIDVLRGVFQSRLEHEGVIRLSEVITHCAEIGLYKGNVSLYIMGAAFGEFIRENAVFYDGVCYWRYSEVRDISSWIIKAYEVDKKNQWSSRSSWGAAMFIDDTGLKERLEYIFNMEPIRDKRFDTLGTAIVHISIWIVENLRYPIAFLDDTLHRLFREDCLYGDKLRRYATYFNTERCEWLRDHIPRADAMARQAIQETAGLDPDTSDHGMSCLPKGHYAPVLYSAEDYIIEMLRKPVFV